MFEESPKFKKEPAPALYTITDEFYQPARIYYQVNQKNALLGRFKRLRCIKFDPEQNRWLWLYQDEAKNIKFTKSYAEIPKEDRPVILGYLSFNSDQQLQIDVCSFDRIVEAIRFFDTKINRHLAKVTKLKIVNKLFPETTTQAEILTHHAFFFEQCQVINYRSEIEKINDLIYECEKNHDDQAKQTVFKQLEKALKTQLPEVEELNLYFYEDGIKSVIITLEMRELEAVEHWEGNKDFSQFDILTELVENIDDDD
jgi:hypothetical protein